MLKYVRLCRRWAGLVRDKRFEVREHEQKPESQKLQNIVHTIAKIGRRAAYLSDTRSFIRVFLLTSVVRPYVVLACAARTA